MKPIVMWGGSGLALLILLTALMNAGNGSNAPEGPKVAFSGSGVLAHSQAFTGDGDVGRGGPNPRQGNSNEADAKANPAAGSGGELTAGDVRRFGAKGDGQHDDTEALQKAVASGSGRVVLPRGTYRLSRTLDIDLSQTGYICIDGGGVATLLMTGAGPALRFLGTHKGTAAPETVPEQVWNRERMPRVEGLEIVGGHPEADGIAASGTMQLTITHVLIRRCRHGIHLTQRNRNVIIANSHIYHNHGIGVFLDHVNLHQINIASCHVSYCGGGGIVCRGGELRNLQICGCDLESNQGKDQPPTANVLIEGGSNAEVAITGCTIQHNHHARGSANIRIRGPSERVIPKTDERREGHITITGNVLSDVMVNIHFDHVRGAVITGNTFWTAYEHNLLIENSSFIVLGENNFDRNPRYWREEREDTANAIVLRRCSECILKGFVISATRACAAAVTLEQCHRCQIQGISIVDCDGVGLLLRGVTRSRISDCLIRDDRPNATSIAVQAHDGKEIMIVDNYLGRPMQIENTEGIIERNWVLQKQN